MLFLALTYVRVHGVLAVTPACVVFISHTIDKYRKTASISATGGHVQMAIFDPKSTGPTPAGGEVAVGEPPLCHDIGTTHIVVWRSTPSMEGVKILLSSQERAARSINPSAGRPRLIGIGMIRPGVSMKIPDDVLKYMTENFDGLVRNLAYMSLVAPKGPLATRAASFAIRYLMMRKCDITIDSATSLEEAIDAAAGQGLSLGMPREAFLTKAKRLNVI